MQERKQDISSNSYPQGSMVMLWECPHQRTAYAPEKDSSLVLVVPYAVSFCIIC